MYKLYHEGLKFSHKLGCQFYFFLFFIFLTQYLKMLYIPYNMRSICFLIALIYIYISHVQEIHNTFRE